MEGLVDNAKSFLNSDEGKKVESSFQDQPTADAQVDSEQQPSNDAFGNQGQPGQYAQQGQYGAVTGGGFGSGGLAKDKDGNGLKAGQGKSAYEGMEQDDSTPSGGYGRNAGGDSFSRANQMGADNVDGEMDDDEGGGAGGYRTGTSTPGYRQEGDVDAEATENRLRNQNLNTYGQQADDSGAKGNDYNEAI